MTSEIGFYPIGPSEDLLFIQELTLLILPETLAGRNTGRDGFRLIRDIVLILNISNIASGMYAYLRKNYR